jgi:hypothetical protein
VSGGPTLAEAIWTDADFDRMAWHDYAVHAIAVEPAPPQPGRLLVDLDYLVDWVRATPVSSWAAACPPSAHAARPPRC